MNSQQWATALLNTHGEEKGLRILKELLSVKLDPLALAKECTCFFNEAQFYLDKAGWLQTKEENVNVVAINKRLKKNRDFYTAAYVYFNKYAKERNNTSRENAKL